MKDLINKLLVIQVNKRIGYSDFSEIKKHPFFENFDWEKLSRRELKSPLERLVKKYPAQFTDITEYSEDESSEILDSFSFANARKSLFSSMLKSQASTEVHSE